MDRETIALIGFIALFILTLIVGSLIKHLVKEIVKVTGLSGTDRVLGSAFGLLRGCLLVVVALGFLARTTAMPGDSWWRESVLIPHFMLVEAWTVDTGQALWQRIMDIGTD